MPASAMVGTLGRAVARLFAEVASADALGPALFEHELGVRVRAGAALDAFVTRDVALGVAGLVGGTLTLSSGATTADLGVAARLEVFF